MSKIKNINGSTPDAEPVERIVSVEINTDNTLIPENYSAKQWLSYFLSDVQNVQNWAGELFQGGFDNNNSKMINLKQAALDSIKEVEVDIAKLKEFLTTYVPPNK